MPGNVSQYNIVLPHATDGDHYQFGIALQSHEHGSSGVMWANCVFHTNASKSFDLYAASGRNFAQNVTASPPDLQTVIANSYFETIIECQSCSE